MTKGQVPLPISWNAERQVKTQHYAGQLEIIEFIVRQIFQDRKKQDRFWTPACGAGEIYFSPE